MAQSRLAPVPAQVKAQVQAQVLVLELLQHTQAEKL